MMDAVIISIGLLLSWVLAYLLGIRAANRRRWKLTQQMDSISPIDIYGYDPKNPMNCGRGKDAVTIEGKTFYKVKPMGSDFER